jgi:hypothetical protein
MTRRAASAIGPRDVTANGQRRLAAPFTARLWRDLAAAVGVRRLARHVGYSESTIYKQGEIETDLLPDEQPQTVRTNPVQAVADALVLAVETGNDGEAVEIVRALSAIVGHRVVPVIVEASQNPVGDCLLAGKSVHSATHRFFEALQSGSPGGASLTLEEVELAQPDLLAAQERIRGALELCALVRIRERAPAPQLVSRAGGKR